MVGWASSLLKPSTRLALSSSMYKVGGCVTEEVLLHPKPCTAYKAVLTFGVSGFAPSSWLQGVTHTVALFSRMCKVEGR